MALEQIPPQCCCRDWWREHARSQRPDVRHVQSVARATVCRRVRWLAWVVRTARSTTLTFPLRPRCRTVTHIAPEVLRGRRECGSCWLPARHIRAGALHLSGAVTTLQGPTKYTTATTTNRGQESTLHDSLCRRLSRHVEGCSRLTRIPCNDVFIGRKRFVPARLVPVAPAGQNTLGAEVDVYAFGWVMVVGCLAGSGRTYTTNCEDCPLYCKGAEQSGGAGGVPVTRSHVKPLPNDTSGRRSRNACCTHHTPCQ